MKPEAQRIAIAEACGWTGITHFDYSGRFVGGTCLWPEHIVENVKQEDAKMSGWRGISPEDKERSEEQNRMLRDTSSGMNNCLVYVPGGFVENKALPDYPNDLNACHEMEKVLGNDEITWGKYQFFLWRILEPHRHVINATAAQRAEAFLKTIGKWEDT